MKINIGETLTLSSGAVLWKQYPTGKPSDGQSYQHFDAGDAFTVVGEQRIEDKDYVYLMDVRGKTFVSTHDYLCKLIR